MIFARQSGFLVYDRGNKCFSAADDVSAAVVAASTSNVDDFIESPSTSAADTTRGSRSSSFHDGESSADSDD
jgi:hypothetical protein